MSKANSYDAPVISEMNMTPLIDVMLVLIIMLIMTIPIQNHRIDQNIASQSSRQSPASIVHLDIDFDGALSWNGAPINSRADLNERLHSVAAKGFNEQDEIQVRPNKRSDYRHVAAVLAAAQRSKLSKIGLVGNDQWM